MILGKIYEYVVPPSLTLKQIKFEPIVVFTVVVVRHSGCTVRRVQLPGRTLSNVYRG
jgi:hypothetical protein